LLDLIAIVLKIRDQSSLESITNEDRVHYSMNILRGVNFF
jgi:hypothetical protein